MDKKVNETMKGMGRKTNKWEALSIFSSVLYSFSFCVLITHIMDLIKWNLFLLLFAKILESDSFYKNLQNMIIYQNYLILKSPTKKCSNFIKNSA